MYKKNTYIPQHCLYCRVKDSQLVSDAFNVDPLYLKHDHQGKIPDYRVSVIHLYFCVIVHTPLERAHSVLPCT